jgi:superfamily I DNA/RNA helicase/RecB family exonuclease
MSNEHSPTLQTAELSPVQRDAVRHDAGPLVVLAGPGTGKTRVITHRVAHAVVHRGVQPEHVLACTFTVAAARELRERLVPLVGSTSAARVRATTLHAFGARLVSRFRGMLGLPARTMLLDRVGQRRLLADVVVREGFFDESLALSLRHDNANARADDDDGAGSLAKPGRGIQGLDALLERVEKATEAIANAGLLPSEALAQAQRHLASTSTTTSQSSPQHEADALRAHDALLLAKTNDAYCRERWKRGLLTFADFQLLPILGLETIPMLRTLVRADVRCIVVDEFQDCNPAQVRLLSLLAGPARSKPDICVVGDDDQGIYAFRGASDRAFELFEKLYPSPNVLSLVDNHRSTDAIVRVANHTISLATHRYKPSKTIRAARSAPTGMSTTVPDRVELLTYEGSAGFVAAAATQAVLERDRARASGKPLLDDFAIITKTNREALDIAALLRAHNVPHREPSPPPPLSHPAAQATLAWARFLVDETDSTAALDVLRSPPWSVPATIAAAIFTIERDVRAAHDRAVKVGSAPGGPRPRMVSILKLLAAPDGLSSTGGDGLWSESLLRALDDAGLTRGELQATLTSVLSLRAELRPAALGSLASDALSAIIQATDPIHAGLPEGREQAQRVRAIVSLLAVARAKQPLLPSPGTLATFLAYLDELLALDSVLRDLRPTQLDDDAPEEFAGSPVEVSSQEESGTADSGLGRVAIITAHASKGLEFGTVVVPRVTPQHGFGATRQASDDELLPDGLLPFGEEVAIAPEEAAKRAADEARRVFYVACTRAKNRLVLLGPKLKGKSKSQNHFFQELSLASASLPLLAAQAPLGLEEQGESPSTVALAAAGLAPSDAPQRKQGLMQSLRAQLARAMDSLLGNANAQSESPELVLARVRALASSDPVRAAQSLGAGHERFVQTLRDSLAADAVPARAIMQRPRLPLHLSYSSLELYDDCPRCWYVRHVMGLPDAESDERLVGNVAHAALEAFYREWQTADSEGLALPTLPRLHALASSAWEQQSAMSGRDAGRAQTDLSHVLALLSNTFARLHRESDHVLEIEHRTNFIFEVDGISHTMDARIDRLDQLATGGLRVIDYKTGTPRKSLLQPDATDLQLGIYAMAISAEYPEVSLESCVGEYWLLRTGERGVIRFADFDLARMREGLSETVRRIVRGEFPAKKACSRGLCQFVPESAFAS